mgnify:CR=1 FL=1
MVGRSVPLHGVVSMPATLQGGASLHFEHKAFQVLALGVVDVDGMVGGLVQLVQNAHVPAALRGGGEHGQAELVLVDGLRATEG